MRVSLRPWLGLPADDVAPRSARAMPALPAKSKELMHFKHYVRPSVLSPSLSAPSLCGRGVRVHLHLVKLRLQRPVLRLQVYDY